MEQRVSKMSTTPRRSATQSKLINVVIQLSLVHATQLRRPINGKGGWQSFLKKLQNRLADDNTIVLTAAEFQKIKNYSSRRYGPGGFEQRLEGIIQSIKEVLE